MKVKVSSGEFAYDNNRTGINLKMTPFQSVPLTYRYAHSQRSNGYLARQECLTSSSVLDGYQRQSCRERGSAKKLAQRGRQNLATKWLWGGQRVSMEALYLRETFK